MPKAIDQTQYDRFVEIARALECDEDKDRFEEKLGEIATQKAAMGDANKPGASPPSLKRKKPKV